MRKQKKVLAWHILNEQRTLGYGDNRKIQSGKTYSIPDKTKSLELCTYGMHASVRLIDALRYAPGPIITRVELSGDILIGNDKLCAEKRKVLWAVDATQVLHLFACKVAKKALLGERKSGREPDPRSFAAIEAKHKYLNGEIDSAALSAAKSAAESAALSAALSAAKSAAWSAAKSAAESAAWSAAKSAAESAAKSAALSAAEIAAEIAAKSAARIAQNKIITKMVLDAAKKQGKL